MKENVSGCFFSEHNVYVNPLSRVVQVNGNELSHSRQCLMQLFHAIFSNQSRAAFRAENVLSLRAGVHASCQRQLGFLFSAAFRY